MRKSFQKLLSSAVFLMGVTALFVSMPAQASTYYTFAVTGSPAGTYTYQTGNGGQYTIGPVGPYEGVLKTVTNGITTSTTSLLVYCLDESYSSQYDTAYKGSVSTPSTQAQEEAAWLAAYSLGQIQGQPSHSQVGIEGPISMAIWELMGTLGWHVPVDPSAQQYITMAQNAFTTGQITPDFLNNVQIFTANNYQQYKIQRFITAIPLPAHDTATPEPGTWAMLAGGLALVLFGSRKRFSSKH